MNYKYKKILLMSLIMVIMVIMDLVMVREKIRLQVFRILKA